MKLQSFRQGFWALALLLVLMTGAKAQSSQSEADATAVQSSEADARADDEDWQFATLTYVWLAGAKGDIDVIGPAQPVGLDLTIKDTIDALKFAFMGAAEARHDRLIFFGDLMFVHLGGSNDITIREVDLLEGELDSRTVAVTALGGYRVAEKQPAIVDVFGGARLNIVENNVELTGPVRSLEGKISETWLDPVVAARANIPLGGKFGLELYGDIGGFGIGSDLTWQGLAAVQYRISRKIHLAGGWRYFKVNYDKGDFLYDVAQSGPIFGVRFQF